MAEQIRELLGKKLLLGSTVIKDKHGNTLTDREEVLQRWKEYVEELYNDKRQEKSNYDLVEPSHPILKEEVEKDVKSMKWRKAEESDGIVVEMVEVAGEFGIKNLTELSSRIYISGSIPEKIKEPEFYCNTE